MDELTQEQQLDRILAEAKEAAVRIAREEGERAIKESVDAVVKEELPKWRDDILRKAEKAASAELWGRMPQNAQRAHTPIGHVHEQGATGGTDCMFDILVSGCFTGTEGTEFTSLTGCPFWVFSNPEDAFTWANTNRQTVGQDTVFYICGGDYEIAAQISLATPNNGSYVIFGTGMAHSTTLVAGGALGSLIAVSNTVNSKSNVTISNLAFEDGNDTNVLLDFAGSRRFNIRDCIFYMGDGASTGIQVGNSATGSSIADCRFVAGGTGINAATDSYFSVVGCVFETGLSSGVVLGGVGHVTISGCMLHADTNITLSSGTISFNVSITGNDFTNNGVSVATSGGGGIREMNIAGNSFSLSGSEVGIDFSASTSSSRSCSVTISGNSFYGGGDAGTIGIRGDTTLTYSSVAIGNSFWDFDTPANAIVDWGSNGLESMHNVSAQFDGTKNTLADTGSPVGHFPGAAGPISMRYNAFLTSGLYLDSWIEGDKGTLSSGTWTPGTDGDIYTMPTAIGFGPGNISTIVGPTRGKVIIVYFEVTQYDLTHSANLVLQDSKNYYPNAGDVLVLWCFGTNQWREIGRHRAGRFNDILRLTTTAKTIASDQLAIDLQDDAAYWTIAGAGGAADDLDGITGGTNGDFIIASAASDTVDITIKHNNAGGSVGAKIFTPDGSDITLDNLQKTVLLFYRSSLDSGNGGWAAAAIGGGTGGSGGTLDQAYDFGGAHLGRTVDVDDGFPVKLRTGDSGTAEITDVILKLEATTTNAAYLQFLSEAGQGILFGDAAATSEANIRYDPTLPAILIDVVGNEEAIRITQNETIIESGLVIGAAPGGTGGNATETLAASQDNWDPNRDRHTVIRINANTSDIDITGIVPTSTNPNWRVLILHNIGTYVVTLKNNSGSSSAGNKFALAGDHRLAVGDACWIQYDDDSNAWRIIGSSGTLADLTDGGATTLHTHAGGSGHTIQDDGVNLAAEAELNFVRSSAGALSLMQAVDNAGAGSTDIYGGYRHYDAIVDSDQYDVLATAVPVYTTLSAAVAAGHVSVLYRASTDAGAVTIANSDTLTYLLGDSLTSASFPQNLTVNKDGCLISNMNFTNVAVTLGGTGTTAQACLFAGTTTVTVSGSGASMIACAGVGLSAATAISVTGAQNRVQASRFSLSSCATAVIDLVSGCQHPSIVGNVWQGSSEAGYFVVNNSAVALPIINGNVFNMPSTATGVVSVGSLANLSGNMFNVPTISSGSKVIVANAGRAIVSANAFQLGSTSSTASTKIVVTNNSGTVVSNNVVIANTIASTASLIFVEDSFNDVIVMGNSWTQTGTAAYKPIMLNALGSTLSYIYTGNVISPMTRAFPVGNSAGTTALGGKSVVKSNGSGMVDIRAYRYE